VRAFIWFEKSGMQSLGTLPGGDYSEALAINNAQQVVGISTSASGKHAFFWSKADGMIDLGVLSGDEASRAVRINDAGLVVGASHSAAGNVHAFLWSKTGRMRHLASLETGDYAEALDINKQGDVVGASGTSRGARASIWKDAGVQDLNGAIAADLNIVLSMALRINDHGQIVCLGVIHRDLPADSYDLDDEHHAGALHAFLLTPTQ
jgi:probable HAF family extracellular repeat protein